MTSSFFSFLFGKGGTIFGKGGQNETELQKVGVGQNSHLVYWVGLTAEAVAEAQFILQARSLGGTSQFRLD